MAANNNVRDVVSSHQNEEKEFRKNPRNLNDYESMLATSTCNVGMNLTLSLKIREEWNHHDDGTTESPTGRQGTAANMVESYLRQAWCRTVVERHMLQVRLVAKEDDIGPLGQRYGLAWRKEHQKNSIDRPKSEDEELFRVTQQAEYPNMVRQLQHVGTTALMITKGTYYVECILQVKNNNDKNGMEEDDNNDGGGGTCDDDAVSVVCNVQMILSLCHAVSDGPGAINVAQSFLQHLETVMEDIQVTTTTTTKKARMDPIQPLIDLQSLLLDSNNTNSSDVVFEGQDEYSKALTTQQQHQQQQEQASSSSTRTAHGISILPPERLQNIPHDSGFGQVPGCIDCIHVTLTPEQTTLLRTKCRAYGTTIQGVLVAAAVKVRLSLLNEQQQQSRTTTLDHDDDQNDLSSKKSLLVGVQIPVNTRRLAVSNVDTENKTEKLELDHHCLCGSAGVWHTLNVPTSIISSDSNSQDHRATWYQLAKHL